MGPIARVTPSPRSGERRQRRRNVPAMPAMLRPGFGLPNLRRNVCPHFYMTGSRGAIPIQAPHLLKALIRQDTNTSRCQLRGGVHMEQGYVNDVCLTPASTSASSTRTSCPASDGSTMTDGRADASIYAEALAALAERGRFGIRLGLGRTRALLRELGQPGADGPRRADRRHERQGQRPRAGRRGAPCRRLSGGHDPEAAPRELPRADRGRWPADRRGRLRPARRARPRRSPTGSPRRHGPPTEFELLTAVVFAHFAEVRPDVALVEVGLGGRLDATHAWDGGVAVVTNVDLDHMDRLGDTITKIAREKAAIIERGDRAVTGARGDGLAVVRRRARRLAVPLTEVAPPPILGWDRDGLEVDLPRPRTDARRPPRPAPGRQRRHRRRDARRARGGRHRDRRRRRRGGAATRAARWPGRLELLRVGGRDVLLDGAHNPAGAATLAVALDDLRPFLAAGPLTLVTASMADKDVDGVIAALAGAAALRARRSSRTSLDVPRALPADDAPPRAGVASGVPVARVVADDPIRWRRSRSRSATGSGPVVVAGSLYLVGVARGQLVDDPDLRDPEPTTP